jgi:hypothetical protein
METHERLAESDRHLRCTAMDALEVLRQRAGFQDDDQAQFQIGLMQLPSGDKVGLIDIRFNRSAHKTVYCVSLPAATHFNAIPDGFPVSRRLEVSLLDQTLIDSRGRVRLKDGRLLRALKIEREHLSLEPSDLDWRVVHLTLELIGAKDCYRSLREGLPPDQRETVPDLYFLDVARLSGLALPPLQDITRYVASRDRKVSGQQIANSLRRFGMRRPQARRA